MNLQNPDISNFIRQIAIGAGKISLEYRRRFKNLKIHRKSMKDLVTEADTAVEGFLVNQIRAAFPDHSIFGEETGFHAGNEFLWILDPIDGTTSFVHGHPGYCISIALQQYEQTIHAAVYAPVLEELYTAEQYQGSMCNGVPIQVSDSMVLQDCLFNSGFSCLRSNWKHNNLIYINRIAPLVRGIRMSGAAALDLAFVACGRIEGYWEMNLNTYDIAAGMLLVSEAGGVTTDFSGTNLNIPGEVFASNDLVHEQMLHLFSELQYPARFDKQQFEL